MANTKITKKSTNQDINNDIAEMLKQLAQRVEQLESENAYLKSNNNSNNTIKKDDPSRLITIIHMDDLIPGLSTVIRGDFEWNFCQMGDRQRIRLGELEKIMAAPDYRYKKNFIRGILIFGKDDQDMYEYNSISPVKSMDIDTFKNIGKLSSDKLGELYVAVSNLHKELILRHWLIQCKDNPIKDYVDLSKLNILNSLSGGKMQHIISDIGNITIKV
jgi:hypothetical protein